VFPLDILFYPQFKKCGLKLRNRIVWHFNFGLQPRTGFAMTLTDLSTIAGLISSVAVLVSLIYLAIQGWPQSAGVDPAGPRHARRLRPRLHLTLASYLISDIYQK
jgi:hypothetical protein